MSFYCQQAEKNKSNRKLIKDLLDDLNCVLNKSFEDNDRVEGDCGNLLEEVERLRAAVECYERLKADLEQKIQELENQIQQLQDCLAKQIQARIELENVTSELKEQLSNQDDAINALNSEKLSLIEAGRQMEMEMSNFRNQVMGLESDRDNLFKGMRGFEMSKGRCGELQQALAECCEQCDCLQKENYELRQKVRDMEGDLDTCCYEKNKMAGEVGKLQQKFQEEKDAMEAQLCQLLEEKAAFAQTKADICRKMNEATAGHHEEMDKLKEEAEKFQNLYETERNLREELEKRLRDCIAGNQVESMPSPPSSKPGSFSGGGQLPTDACAELRRQLALSNDKKQELQKLYDKESAERKLLEKRLNKCERDKMDAETRASFAEKRKSSS